MIKIGEKGFELPFEYHEGLYAIVDANGTAVAINYELTDAAFGRAVANAMNKVHTFTALEKSLRTQITFHKNRRAEHLDEIKGLKEEIQRLSKAARLEELISKIEGKRHPVSSTDNRSEIEWVALDSYNLALTEAAEIVREALK